MNIRKISNYLEITENINISKLIMQCMFSPTQGKVLTLAQAIYAKTQGVMFVCEDNHEVIGLIGGVEIDGVHFVIKHVSVNEDYRRQGIARMLFNHLIQYKKYQSIKTTADHETTRFYRSVGFDCNLVKDHILDITQYHCVWDRNANSSELI